MRQGLGRDVTTSMLGLLAAGALAAALSGCGTHRGEGGWAKDANATVRDAANSVGIGLGTPASPAAMGNGKHEGIKELEDAEESGRRDGMGPQPGPDDWRIITNSFGLFRHAPYVADVVLGLLAAVGVGLVLTASGRGVAAFDPVGRAEQRRATVTCALIGCIAAELVQAAEQFFLGAEIALVLFGIGGLVRFRTVFDDPRQTGLAIIAAVLGLACGMSEYSLAGIALSVVYLVNWWLTRTTVLRIRVRGRKGADLAALQESVSRELGTRGIAILRTTPIAADREIEFFARTESDIDLDDLVGALHGAAPGARVRVNAS